MKVLIANKFYYPRGGDCIYAINLEQLLKENGHDTAVFAMQHPQNLTSPWSSFFPSQVDFNGGKGKIKAALRTFGDNEVKRNFTALIDEFKPDVVHLNNIHSQLSPVIASIAKKKGVRVVWTIHDCKLICPRYDCLRNGNDICEKCFNAKWNVVRYACMKNSLPASIMAFLEAEKWNKKALQNSTDAFICPSCFMQSKMTQAGWDKNKLYTIHNFIDTDKLPKDISKERDDYFCYVGRLSREKGVLSLIEAANISKKRLVIVGDGPLMDQIKNMAGNNISLMGFQKWDKVKEIVGRARFAVMPSETYENNPLAVIESLCLGTPVLGADIGGIPELIEENVSGMTFKPKDINNLNDKIEDMMTADFNYGNITEKARHAFNKNNHYNQLVRIYKG